MRPFLILVLCLATAAFSRAESPWVFSHPDGALGYTADARGNRIPDFSNVGYHGGGVALPALPVAIEVEPGPGDAGARIQQAIDGVARMPANAQGWRGAILLKKGRYPIAGSLLIQVGGIVLRGEGAGEAGTVLVATGAKQRSLVIVGNGRAPRNEEEENDSPAPQRRATPLAITDAYVPVGAHRFHVTSASDLRVGQEIIVHRPSTQAWIHVLGMDRIPPHPGRTIVQWKPGSKDLLFSRVITGVTGNEVTIDAPLTCALDQTYGGGGVLTEVPTGSVAEVGIENLRGDSEYRSSTDENHGWVLVDLLHARNSWVRQVTAVHFGYSCVYVEKACKWVTVDHCVCLDPISQITGGRRYSFALDGQLTLFEHCYSRNGRHDFVVHALAAGPNVFFDCQAELSHADSGPHHRWSVGVLYDNVQVSGAERGGGEINIRDRGNMGTGHGWAGANQVVWNCQADAMNIANPPTAQNWVLGPITRALTGNGYRQSVGTPVAPRSLYLAQLEERLRPAAVHRDPATAPGN